MTFSLRHTAKEILAAAVCELFPGTLLVGGHADELGFTYDFLFQKNIIQVFSQRELFHIEEKMRLIAAEKRPIQMKEMMRENGALFLSHLKQPLRADAAEELPENVISLFNMGEFYDLASPPYLSNSYELKAFQLLDFTLYPIENATCVRIQGTAFSDKKELKEFVKKYKTNLKKSFTFRGPKEGYYLPLDEEKWVLLPKGEALLHRLTDYWRKAHLEQGFSLLKAPKDMDIKEIQNFVHHENGGRRLASLDLEKGDCISVWLEEREVAQELISSLHFIGQTFKIFGFEISITLVGSDAKKGKILREALESAHLQYETQSAKVPGIEFCSADCFGRKMLLSYLTLDEDKERVVYRSLFSSLQKWLALCIEYEKE